MDPRELLDAIVATPDDDAVRRVYADALLDADEPQGELIHIQCDLARARLTRDEAVDRRRRERALLDKHAARWTAGLRGLATFPVFRRGFIDELVVDPSVFAGVGERLFAAAPALRGVMLEDLSGSALSESEHSVRLRILGVWQQAITCPAFGRIRGMGYREIGYECRVFGEVTPGWESLGSEALLRLLATGTSDLDCLVSNDWGYQQGLDALTKSVQVKTLTRLAIRTHGPPQTKALLQALAASRIRSLSLAGDWLGVLDQAVLATLSELRIEAKTVELAFAGDKLERFAFADRTIEATDVDQVARTARGVRELCLDGHTVPGYRQLARADLAHLRELRVYGEDIGYEQAVEILEMPCAARLEVLQLKQLDAGERSTLEQRFGVVVDIPDLSRSYVYWR